VIVRRVFNQSVLSAEGSEEVMMDMAAVTSAVVWTYWLAVPILIVAIGMALGIGLAFLFRVVKPYRDSWAQFVVDQEARERAARRTVSAPDNAPCNNYEQAA
jgi:uncharacterized membrane protein YccC